MAAERDRSKFMAAEAKRDWGKSVAAERDQWKLFILVLENGVIPIKFSCC